MISHFMTYILFKVGLKGQFTQKWKICHLLTLELFNIWKYFDESL